MLTRKRTTNLTTEQKREMLLRIADRIERDASLYDFWSCRVPKSLNCGTPTCILGWIAFELGIPGTDNPNNTYLTQAAYEVFGYEDWKFYENMDYHDVNERWMDNNIDAANTLRRLVDEEFPLSD